MLGRGFDPRRLHNDEADWKKFSSPLFLYFFQQKMTLNESIQSHFIH